SRRQRHADSGSTRALASSDHQAAWRQSVDCASSVPSARGSRGLAGETAVGLLCGEGRPHSSGDTDDLQAARESHDGRGPRCGCTEALVLALKVVSRPGDTIAIESPTYFGFLQVLEALDLRALELPTDARGGVDLAALRSALGTASVKACLFSSSFNNPLGCTMSDERKKAVLELLAKH